MHLKVGLRPSISAAESSSVRLEYVSVALQRALFQRSPIFIVNVVMFVEQDADVSEWTSDKRPDSGDHNRCPVLLPLVSFTLILISLSRYNQSHRNILRDASCSQNYLDTLILRSARAAIPPIRDLH